MVRVTVTLHVIKIKDADAKAMKWSAATENSQVDFTAEGEFLSDATVAAMTDLFAHVAKEDREMKEWASKQARNNA